MKQVSNKAGKIDKAKIGEQGEKMGFDEFKIIETCIFRLEERLLSDLKDESKRQRREVLKKEMAGQGAE